MWQKRNKKRIFKGSVTVFALLLMFILAVTTIGIISTAAIERKVSISTGNSTTAFQIAESGMERTLQYFKSNFDKTLNDINGPTNCSGGIVKYDPQSINTIRFKDNATPIPNYLACIEPISKVKIIKSIGTTKQETRAIEADVFLGATKLLLHLNGPGDSGEFADSSFYWNNHAVTASDGVSVSDSELKFGTGSAKFDGTGYLSVPDSNDWNFNTGDFTIDFWVNFTSMPPNVIQSLMGQYINANHRWDIALRGDSGNSIMWYYLDGATEKAIFTPGLTASTWYHLAFVMKEQSAKIYVNGVGGNATDFSGISWQDLASDLNIGQSGTYNYFNGYLDELRISKGIARWASDFDPYDPTTEYWPD